MGLYGYTALTPHHTSAQCMPGANCVTVASVPHDVCDILSWIVLCCSHGVPLSASNQGCIDVFKVADAVPRRGVPCCAVLQGIGKTLQSITFRAHLEVGGLHAPKC